jgi:hypothetical protein
VATLTPSQALFNVRLTAFYEPAPRNPPASIDLFVILPDLLALCIPPSVDCTEA